MKQDGPCRWPRAAVLGGVVFALAALEPRAARAETAPRDPAAARALFFEARDLAAAGRHAEACPKFEESLRLDYGIGTQFNLADCWERLGRTASAWAAFLDTAAAARAAGQGEREKVATERARALESKLSRLVIHAAKDAPGLEVRRDGIVVGSASFGSATPVDPGPHRIDVSQPGRKPWSTQIDVPATLATVSVNVPELEPAARAAEGAPRPAPAPSAAAGTGERRSNTGLVIGGVATGVFAAGAITSGVLYGSRRSEFERKNTADDPERFDARDSAKTLGVVNLALTGAALVSAGVTLYFWLSRPSEASTSARLELTPLAGPGFAGATLGGRL